MTHGAPLISTYRTAYHEWGMHPEIYESMKEWCLKHADSPKVAAWLEANPPAKGWGGTPLEWAYTEMPIVALA